MRRIALVVGVAAIVLGCGQASFGQGFQGGLRGAIRDAGGGVPGAAITLTNENTNLARTTLTNAQGEYAFAAVEPGTYRVKVGLTGFKTIERAGVRVGTQSFLILDLTLEVGSIEESITVSGQTPLIETANASHGTVLDWAALETLPAPGRAAFLMAVSIPTVDAIRRRSVQPAAGPDRMRRCCRSAAARAAATTTRSTASRSPTSSTARWPTRPWRRSTTSRCRCTPTTRRWDAPAAACSTRRMRSGTNMFRRHRVLPDASALGPGEQLLQRARGPAKARERVLPRRRRRRRSDYPEQDVLLFCRRELPRHPVAQRVDHIPDRRGAAGRLLPADQLGGPAGDHLRPSDAAAVSRQRHPRAPDQSGRRGDRWLPAAARHRRRQRHQQLYAHGRDQQPLPAGIHVQSRAQVQRQGVADRLLPVQPHRRAGCELLRGRD